MDIKALLAEQRRTGDEFRVAEKAIQDLQTLLSGRGIDAASRSKAEAEMASGWIELARLGQRRLELDASVTNAALR